MPADLRIFSPRCVVIVAAADCREVLETALEQRGLETYTAASVRSGLALVCRHEPDVVIFDGEAAGAGDGPLQAQLQAHLARRGTPLVALGRLRGQTLLPQRVLAKPYHFAPLVHTIEALAAAKAA